MTRICLLTLIASFSLVATSQAQRPSDSQSKKTVILKGRVVAYVNSITYGSWYPKYQDFLFLPEEKSNQKTASKPVRVIYEFFKRDGYLNGDFFDYSKRFELKVMRRTGCDEKRKDFCYMTLSEEVDEKRTETKISILRVLDGAANSIVGEDEVLPCYVLKENNYTLTKGS